MSEEDASEWRMVAMRPEDDYVEKYKREVLGERRTEPIYWRDSRFNSAAQPVVGVNWYEAMAYASWLTQVAGVKYRLPTEAEWEWGARRNERRYPWGNDWDPARCNDSDSRLGQPSPVGVYPHGATPDTPYGLHDMAGNVYEWTATLYRPYCYDPADGRENLFEDDARVTRGGSWYFERTHVRCAWRHRLDPRYYRYDQGFRLAKAECVKNHETA